MAQTSIHPVLDAMLKLGCKQQSQIAIAFQVYVDLVDAHVFWDVQHKYNEKLNMIYMTARKTKSAPLEVFVPISVKSKLTMEYIQILQAELSDTVTLAIKDADSTVVLYRLGNGLVTPETPEDTKQRKKVKDRRFKVDQELAKNKMEIFQKAQHLESGAVDKELAKNKVEIFQKAQHLESGAVDEEQLTEEL